MATTTKKAVKKTAKPAAKKAAAVTTRGNTYQLTASGKKSLTDIAGQGAIIRDAIAQYGPITSAELVAKIGSKLNTENPAKNIAFYLCTWKSDGFVAFGPKPKK